MIKKRFLLLYKTFIYISLFNFIFGQISVGSSLYHIPPNPPTIGETVSFEATIPSDIKVMNAVFLFKMKGDSKSKNYFLVIDTFRKFATSKSR